MLMEYCMHDMGCHGLTQQYQLAKGCKTVKAAYQKQSIACRWSNEAAAALEELEKTKHALQAISQNVSCLVCLHRILVP